MDMDENRLKSAWQRLPDAMKGLLGLITGIAAIIVAIRTDRQLYVVIFTGIILAIWLSYAVYVVFARRPGTFSNKGTYRFEPHRWAGFISIGFVIGFILSFSLFKPNRSYVSEVFVGTPTPTSSRTLSPTLAASTPTGTPTPVATNTETPTLTPTPVLIFRESFLDNSNGWEIAVSRSDYIKDYTVSQRIIGGKLEYSMLCGNSESSSIYCKDWLQIPRQSLKNFDLAFDVKITDIPRDNIMLNIGIRFREAAGAYYEIYYLRDGTVSLYRSGNGISDFIAEEIYSTAIKRGLNETNHFRIVAEDSTFIIYANDQEITRQEDGINSSFGNIYLGIWVNDRGSTGKVEFDNILIQEVN